MQIEVDQLSSIVTLCARVSGADVHPELDNDGPVLLSLRLRAWFRFLKGFSARKLQGKAESRLVPSSQG